MTLAAVAQAAARAAKRRPETRDAVLDDRHEGEQRACEQRHDEREQEYRRVERHLIDSGEILRRELRQKAQAAVREEESHDTPHQAEREALEEKLARDVLPLGPERGADSE